jgi:hypothetical protein
MNNRQRDFGIFYNKLITFRPLTPASEVMTYIFEKRSPRRFRNTLFPGEPWTTSWPSSSGLRGRRRTYFTILELADHALIIHSPSAPLVRGQ